MIYLLLGRRELGKTTLAIYMARKVPYQVIFDPRGLCTPTTGARVTTPDELASAIRAMQHETAPIKELIVTPRDDVQEMFDGTAGFVKYWAETYPRTDHAMAFVVDEARFVDLKRSRAFGWVTRASPRDLFHVIVTAHRPTDVPTDLRAIADHWYLFRCSQEHDLDAIEERCGTRAAGTVSRLEPHHFLHWDDSIGAYTVNKTPQSWKIELRSPSTPGPNLTPAGEVFDSDGLF